MKRKLMREFADYLTKTRRRFNMDRSDHCVAAHAVMFTKGVASVPHSTASDLDRIFDIGYKNAFDIYTGYHVTSRKDWATILRRFAKTGVLTPSAPTP
jgi:hypothetical protein